MRLVHIFIALVIYTLLAGCAQDIPKPPDSLTGTPSWFPIGPEIYHESDIAAAEQTVLKLRTESRWFEGFSTMVSRKEFDEYMHREHLQEKYSIQQTRDDRYPIPDPPVYPKSAADVPVEDRGVRLSLSISPSSDPAVLAFTMTLKSDETNLTWEVEHRWSNTLPMLFAFYVDQKAIAIESTGFGEMGGATWEALLTRKGVPRTWHLKVDAQSIQKLLPDSSPHSLTVFAAFANYQHHGYSRVHMMHMYSYNSSNPKRILVRSNAASLRWDGHRWLNE